MGSFIFFSFWLLRFRLFNWLWKLAGVFGTSNKKFRKLVKVSSKIRFLNIMKFFQEIISRIIFSQCSQWFTALFCLIETFQTQQCIYFLSNGFCAFWIDWKCRITVRKCFLILFHDIAATCTVRPKRSIANMQLYGFRIAFLIRGFRMVVLWIDSNKILLWLL